MPDETTHLQFGPLLLEVRGLSFPFAPPSENLWRSAVSASVKPDAIVELVVGDEPDDAIVLSKHVDQRVDAARGRVLVHRSDWRLEADLGAGRATVAVGGRWGFPLVQALASFVQLLVVERGLGFVAHSSCVAGPEGAVLFSGPSGAGKSTAATLAAAAGALTLNDELSMVTGVDDGIPRVWSALALNPKQIAEPAMTSAPLRRIYWLTHADEDAVSAVGTAAGARLLSRVVRVGLSEPEAFRGVRLFDMVCSVVERVPVRVLRFRERREFWAMVSDDLAGSM